MTENEVRQYINAVKWQFAKSMPQMPHEYTVKAWRVDLLTIFNEFVLYIRKNGYREIYKRKVYLCLNINGYKYWTMGSALDKTILI